MTFEVEQKYRVADHGELRRAIAELGATLGDTVTQIDTYYAHPSRDFAATDEALRIRRVDQQNVLTYKGPKIDAATKTRRELELAIAPGDPGANLGSQLLEALGFRPVGQVSKVRTAYRLQHHAGTIELVLDEVDQLGPFVELEITAHSEDQIEPGRQAIAAVAGELGLREVQRRSYLELLLDRSQ